MRAARPAEMIDHRAVEWERVAQAAYLIEQTYRYDYPDSISELDHRLIVVPPQRFGDQRRVVHRVAISQEGDVQTRQDSFGNTVLDLRFPRVERSIEFQARIRVERRAAGGSHQVPAAWLRDPRLLEPSDLTQPDARLAQAAACLAAEGEGGLPLATRVNAWVFRAMRYRSGATGVGTTAAGALALGCGVCQDYAHVMIAICRLLGLPTRYVSGHLLGEGGTHAWVEVLMGDADNSELAVAWPFDPTNGRTAGLDYVTVAVGRDYRDVAPTSGAYLGGPSGRLTSRKRVGLTGVEYLSA